MNLIGKIVPHGLAVSPEASYTDVGYLGKTCDTHFCIVYKTRQRGLVVAAGNFVSLPEDALAHSNGFRNAYCSGDLTRTHETATSLPVRHRTDLPRSLTVIAVNA